MCSTVFNLWATPFADAVKDWVCSIVIGFLVVSYWRGSWVLIDIWTCGQPDDASLSTGNSFCFHANALTDPYYTTLRRDSALIAYLIGQALIFLGVLLMWMGLWLPSGGARENITPVRATIRFIIVYILGAACVCTWRGIWYLTDIFFLPNHLTDGSSTSGVAVPLLSFWASSLLGSSGAFFLLAGGALLACPAIFLLDGPGFSPPPLTVTIVSSYYSLSLPAGTKQPKLNIFVLALDVVLSFILLPILVVMFWRGSWMVLDTYLWKFSPEPRDIHCSILWGAVLSAVLMGVTCEPFVARIPSLENRIFAEFFGRARTYLLAWGAVSFWRVVWYVWDEFIGGPSYISAWVSHSVGVVLLAVFGCASCITAPPATLGVDAVPHPQSTEEPLFSMHPVPYETLQLFGLGRKPFPETVTPEDVKKMGTEMGESAFTGSTAKDSTNNANSSNMDSAIELGLGRSSSTRYLQVQRPELTRRLSHSASFTARSGVYSVTGSIRSSGTARKHSPLYRNR